ncbi:MAG: hypothetical protein K8R02_04625 [Anaerohalosphaeraceae bacterium]|nr:hypothetical protein [Anaerohalosphaeraceae bacterium]
MARKKKTPEPEQPAGAPEWMVTFSDCMTLLLTFFVLLLSFSSFDDQSTMRDLRRILGQKACIEAENVSSKDSMAQTKPIKYLDELDEGSEKPTLVKGKNVNLREEIFSREFDQRKVFLVDSEKIFWGKGSIISQDGRKSLTDMAALLAVRPSRIVISENGRNNETAKVGLERACAVISYLAEKHGLDKNRFSVSAATTVGDLQDNMGKETDRLLEIILLERSIYN